MYEFLKVCVCESACVCVYVSFGVCMCVRVSFWCVCMCVRVSFGVCVCVCKQVAFIVQRITSTRSKLRVDFKRAISWFRRWAYIRVALTGGKHWAGCFGIFIFSPVSNE